MVSNILLVVFLASTAIQLFFWLYFFSRLAFHKPEPPTAPEYSGPTADCRTAELPTADCPPVTVIICAHNEEANLREHLDRFLNQTYRSYHVLVVLHNSSDNSEHVLSSLQQRFSHLRIAILNDNKTGKKSALVRGIELAEHKVLLLTDADCLPASDHWISGMVAGFDEKTSVVLGVSPYMEAPGLLNIFIRYEAFYTAMQYLSFALAGFPYMGVGRNLAYRKELFEKVGGFQKHESIASGDDDLFVNEAAQPGMVGIRLNPDSFTWSKPKNTWQEYFRQKKRHFSTGKKYKKHHKLLLSSLAMSHFLHYTTGFFLLALNFSIIFVLLGFTVRICVVMALSSIILKKLQYRSLWFWVPFLDVALILFYIIFSRAILMNNDTQRWN